MKQTKKLTAKDFTNEVNTSKIDEVISILNELKLTEEKLLKYGVKLNVSYELASLIKLDISS